VRLQLGVGSAEMGGLRDRTASGSPPPCSP
jgi:hypothetical protein